MGKKVSFSSAQLETIHDALAKRLRIRDVELREEILDEIARTGAVRTFGYGSLVHTPHTRIDHLTPARLHGWAKGFVVYDPFYRGTREEPGLTLGLEPDEASHTDGAMLESNFAGSNSCPQSFAETVAEYIHHLAIREMPVDEPLYRFRMLAVTLDNGETHKALACVADTKSRLYAGKDMTLDERAEIIARSFGYGTAPTRDAQNRLSNLDYIRKCIHANLEMGDDPCPRMMKLLSRANAIRRELDDETRADLDTLEKGGYHPRVYD